MSQLRSRRRFSRVAAASLASIGCLTMVAAAGLASGGAGGAPDGPWGGARVQVADQPTVTLSAEESAQVREAHLGRGKPADASEIVAHHRTRLDDDAELSVLSYRNSSGETCFGPKIPGGQGVTCLSASEFRASGPITFLVGGRQARGQVDLTRWDTIWVYGVVTPAIDRVEMSTLDCSRKVLPVDGDGYFFTVIPAAELYSGGWPIQLIGYGEQGQILATRQLLVAPPQAHSVEDAPLPPTCTSSK